MQRKQIVPPFKFWGEGQLIKCFLLLPGHTGHSEHNLSAPLLSISFGLPAIFLIGGASLSSVPAALILRSGDVLVMEREARLAYHAVPRILEREDGPAGPCQDRVEESFQLLRGFRAFDWLKSISIKTLPSWD